MLLRGERIPTPGWGHVTRGGHAAPSPRDPHPLPPAPGRRVSASRPARPRRPPATWRREGGVKPCEAAATRRGCWGYRRPHPTPSFSLRRRPASPLPSHTARTLLGGGRPPGGAQARQVQAALRWAEGTYSCCKRLFAVSHTRRRPSEPEMAKKRRSRGEKAQRARVAAAASPPHAAAAMALLSPGPLAPGACTGRVLAPARLRPARGGDAIRGVTRGARRGAGARGGGGGRRFGSTSPSRLVPHEGLAGLVAGRLLRRWGRPRREASEAGVGDVAVAPGAGEAAAAAGRSGGGGAVRGGPSGSP